MHINTSEDIRRDINRQKRQEERGEKASRNKLAAELKRQRQERDKIAKAEAKRQKRLAELNRLTEDRTAKAKAHKALAEEREYRHRARAAHPLVRLLSPSKPAPKPRKRRKAKLFGRGGGWGL